MVPETRSKSQYWNLRNHRSKFIATKFVSDYRSNVTNPLKSFIVDTIPPNEDNSIWFLIAAHSKSPPAMLPKLMSTIIPAKIRSHYAIAGRSLAGIRSHYRRAVPFSGI